MIGLGDRHNDNILIQKNGAVSHIDFDCIFEKGTILPIPEVMNENDCSLFVVCSFPSYSQHSGCIWSKWN